MSRNTPAFVPREQLSLTDLEALRDAPYLDRMLADAGLMGPCEGILSSASATFEDVDAETKLLRFGPMVLAGFKNVGAASDLSSGIVAPFVPTNPDQLQTTVNVVAYEGSTGVLWWRSGLIPSRLGNRRQWQPGFPLGRAIAMNTMLRTRLYFAATADFDTAPDDGNTWYRLASFGYPEGGPPTLRWCHALDLGYDLSPTIANAKFLGQSMIANHASGSNDGRSYGIARALAVLTNVIMAIKDRDHSWDLETMEITVAGAEDLLARTYRGLKQLDDDLTALNSTVTIGLGESVTQLEDLVAGALLRISALESANTTRTKVIWSAEVAINGTITNQVGDVLGFGTVTVTPGVTGTFDIQFPISLSTHIAMVMERPATLAAYGRKTVTWINDGKVQVKFWNAADAAADCAFNVSVTGNF